MADAVETVGQDVEEVAADELVGRQRHRLTPNLAGGAGAIILPAERDPVPIHGDEAAVGDGDAVGVAGGSIRPGRTARLSRPARRSSRRRRRTRSRLRRTSAHGERVAILKDGVAYQLDGGELKVVSTFLWDADRHWGSDAVVEAHRAQLMALGPLPVADGGRGVRLNRFHVEVLGLLRIGPTRPSSGSRRRWAPIPTAALQHERRAKRATGSHRWPWPLVLDQMTGRAIRPAASASRT